MAFEIPGFSFTRDADADLTTKQFFCVKAAAGGEIALSGDGEAILGILQNDPNTGEAGNVMSAGISKAVAGAAITEGDLIASDANGKIITAASADRTIGQALDAASADGDIIEVLLGSFGRIA